jgi:hypothetical protein
MHESERVPLSVAKERHPQLVVGHLGNEMRLIAKVDAARLQVRVGGLNIVVPHFTTPGVIFAVVE